MLSLEQIHQFEDAVKRAKQIIIRQVDSKSTPSEMRYHMRVSGRKNVSGQWVIGLIFGTRKESDWLKIADVNEADLRAAKTEYRSMLKQLMHVK
ncbi:hypothetical protein Q6I89_004320 [Salmonella enterica]|nr:hypothetical protein [Salmonella enterica]EJT3914018.1 hypothetical protein [Salmonella enterica]ELL1509960.1 hypothetical protein [Salmonella enterica]